MSKVERLIENVQHKVENLDSRVNTKLFLIDHKVDETKKIIEENIIEENNKTMKLLKQTKQRLEWYDYFVDYVEGCDRNLYNDACEYADNKEMERGCDRNVYNME